MYNIICIICKNMYKMYKNYVFVLRFFLLNTCSLTIYSLTISTIINKSLPLMKYVLNILMINF